MTVNRAFNCLSAILAISILPGCSGARAVDGTGKVETETTSGAVASSLDAGQWSNSEAQRLPLSELPEPADDGESGYPAFTNYAVQTAAQAERSTQVLSALVDPKSLTTLPRRLGCVSRFLAVVIDLDPGQRPLDLADPPYPMPGLAEQLDRLHKAGVSVLWATSLRSRDRAAVEARLTAVGLALSGLDRVLVAGSDKSKADAERTAAQQFCIVAVAGDQIGDFDEALVHLKDKKGPVGSMLLSNIGSGWFFADLPTQ